MRKTHRKSAFEKWWSESRNGLGPKYPHDVTPLELMKFAFDEGRKSVPTSKKLRKALEDLLGMLEDWDSGFDGFGEVNQAEKLLGHPTTQPR